MLQNQIYTSVTNVSKEWQVLVAQLSLYFVKAFSDFIASIKITDIIIMHIASSCFNIANAWFSRFRLRMKSAFYSTLI